MSDFVFLFRTDAASARKAMGTPEQAQKSLEAWLAWIRSLEAQGALKDRGLPLERSGAVVRGGGKNRLVTDGPYVEAKDMVLGFLVVTARDLSHATALGGACPMVLGGGSVEIRPVAHLAI